MLWKAIASIKTLSKGKPIYGMASGLLSRSWFLKVRHVCILFFFLERKVKA